jgi:4-hydroxybenzoate polyprenyltransferase
MVGVPARPSRPGVGLRAMVLATHAGPAVAVTLVATLLAVAAGVPAGRVVLLTAAVLAGQASIGWSNDWLDADRDRAVARADKPVVQGAVSPSVLRSAAVVGAVVAVVLSLLLGWAPGLLLLVLVASGWAYNAGLKRTAASLLPYVTGFGTLPAAVLAAAPGTPLAPWWLVGAGGALGAAAHLANAAPDLEDDLATGVRGLPHRLGPRWIAPVAAAVLVAATVVVLVGASPAPGVLAAVAVLVVVLAAVVVRGRARVPFVAAVAIALVDATLLVVAR